MKKLFILLSLVSFIHAVGLNTYQLQVLQDIAIVSDKYKDKIKEDLKPILLSIYYLESSAGINILGDRYTKTGKVNTIYESSLGAGQIQLRTAQIVLNKYPYLAKRYSYLIHPNIYSYNEYVKVLKNIDKFKRIINNPRWNTSKTTKGLNTMSWANKELIKNKEIFSAKYENDSKIDDLLLNKLLRDHKFSAIISIHYLIMNYEEAQKRKKPLVFSAISKYNGGWNNTTYFNKVKNIKEKIIEPLIRKGIIR